MSKRAKLAKPKVEYWKARGKYGKPKFIAITELSDEHLQRAYFTTQNKELEYTNKSIIFAELREKLEREAKRRNITLRSIEDEENHEIGSYFNNDRLIKSRT